MTILTRWMNAIIAYKETNQLLPTKYNSPMKLDKVAQLKRPGITLNPNHRHP